MQKRNNPKKPSPRKSPRPRHNDLDFLDATVQPVYEDGRIQTKETVIYNHTFNIVEQLTNLEDYLGMLDILDNASEEDSILIRVSSVGGLAEISSLLATAIDSCKASVTGLIGDAASAATQVLLACHSWQVTPQSSFMVHNFSYGTAGKDSDVWKHVDFMRKQNGKVFRHIYTGFLTEAEILKGLEGEEFYFDADEIQERLASYAAYRNKLLTAQEAEDDMVEAEDFGEGVEADDPDTWVPGVTFILKKKIRKHLAGTMGMVLETYTTSLGTILEFSDENNQPGLILPEEFSLLTFGTSPSPLDK